MKKMVIDMNIGKVTEDVEVHVKKDSGIITGFQFKTNDGVEHNIRLGWIDRVRQKLGQKINLDEIELDFSKSNDRIIMLLGSNGSVIPLFQNLLPIQ